MKKLKINVPEGYEIDKDKSTFENIVFKPIVKTLPKTWEELEKIDGYFINPVSKIRQVNTVAMNSEDKNIFATEEQAEAAIALAQLSQLMKVYNGEWEPDWSNEKQKKFIINFYYNKIYKGIYTIAKTFLTFKDEETRDLFLDNFTELILKAKPLL